MLCANVRNQQRRIVRRTESDLNVVHSPEQTFIQNEQIKGVCLARDSFPIQHTVDCHQFPSARLAACIFVTCRLMLYEPEQQQTKIVAIRMRQVQRTLPAGIEYFAWMNVSLYVIYAIAAIIITATKQ